MSRFSGPRRYEDDREIGNDLSHSNIILFHYFNALYFAVAEIADRTAYDVSYSYRPLSGIAVVCGQHEYLFIYSLNCCLLLLCG